LDDHEIVAAGLAALLGEAESEIEVVWRGGRVCELWEFLATAEPPSCVLVDVDLGPDNPSAAAVVVSLTDRGIPSLLVSALERGRLVREALLAGACGYIHKGAAPEQLAAAVRIASRGELLLDDAAAEILLDVATPNLSPRELEVLRLYAMGLPQKSVARRMSVSENTVGEYLKRIRGKYAAVGRSVHTKQELYQAAVADALIDEAPGGSGAAAAG
jgi:DNA-binding NarL/FixJ family response regulator